MDDTTLTWPDALDKPFQAIIFDWDGTAVPDRTTPVPELVDALDRLLRQKVIIVIITGTNFHNIDQQGVQYLSALARRFLYVCTNRGSEVYGFLETGDPLVQYQRVASDAENAALDRIALSLQSYFKEQMQLSTEVISDRLNRRKIDLIPLPEWKDPKKSQFARLLTAVRTRLENAGLSGGLGAILDKLNRLPGKRDSLKPRLPPISNILK